MRVGVHIALVAGICASQIANTVQVGPDRNTMNRFTTFDFSDPVDTVGDTIIFRERVIRNYSGTDSLYFSPDAYMPFTICRLTAFSNRSQPKFSYPPFTSAWGARLPGTGLPAPYAILASQNAVIVSGALGTTAEEKTYFYFFHRLAMQENFTTADTIELCLLIPPTKTQVILTNITTQTVFQPYGKYNLFGQVVRDLAQCPNGMLAGRSKGIVSLGKPNQAVQEPQE